MDVYVYGYVCVDMCGVVYMYFCMVCVIGVLCGCVVLLVEWCVCSVLIDVYGGMMNVFSEDGQVCIFVGKRKWLRICVEQHTATWYYEKYVPVV